MVVLTDFLVGVLSAIVLYAVLHRFFDRHNTASPQTALKEQEVLA